MKPAAVSVAGAPITDFGGASSRIAGAELLTDFGREVGR